MIPEEKKSQFDISGIMYKVKGAVLNFLIPLISILIAAILVFFYIYPSFKSLPAKKEDLKKKLATKSTLNTKVLDLNRLVDYQATLDENLDIVNKVLVPEPEVPRLLDQASQLAEKAGMSLDKLSYSYSSKSVAGGGFDLVTVSMGLKANYDQLILFMELVENAARYVSIPTFRYTVSTKDSGVSDGAEVSSTFSMDSPYLFVQSAAVTDDPIKIDITSSEFIEFMNMLKGLDYYDFLNSNIEAVEEKPVVVEEEVTTEPVSEIEEEPVIEPVENAPVIPAQ